MKTMINERVQEYIVERDEAVKARLSQVERMAEREETAAKLESQMEKKNEELKKTTEKLLETENEEKLQNQYIKQ